MLELFAGKEQPGAEQDVSQVGLAHREQQEIRLSHACEAVGGEKKNRLVRRDLLDGVRYYGNSFKLKEFAVKHRLKGQQTACF